MSPFADAHSIVAGILGVWTWVRAFSLGTSCRGGEFGGRGRLLCRVESSSQPEKAAVERRRRQRGSQLEPHGGPEAALQPHGRGAHHLQRAQQPEQTPPAPRGKPTRRYFLCEFLILSNSFEFFKQCFIFTTVCTLLFFLWGLNFLMYFLY